MKGGEQLTVDCRLDLLFGQLSLDGAIKKETAPTAPTQSYITRCLVSPEKPQPLSGCICSLKKRQLSLWNTFQLFSEVEVALDVTHVQVAHL